MMNKSLLDESNDEILNDQQYITDEKEGKNWRFLLGDSTERIAEIPDESVHLSIFSPPFQSLYVYSASPRDMGNAVDMDDFLDQYHLIIKELLRITKPGRMACVHCAQIATTKNFDGVTGLIDLRGRLIQTHVQAGWIYHGEVTVNKNPQAQAIRTKSPSLMFVTMRRDSLRSRPALADYLLIFRKPGESDTKISNTENVPNRITEDEWIEYAAPVWTTINETNTLNSRIARDTDDERHMTPLQLDFIDRCVRLWSKPKETVFTPFGGVGSELYQAVKRGRKAIGIELKPSYWKTGCDYLKQLEIELSTPTIF